MPAILKVAADKINADTAGLTSAEPKVPTAQSTSPTEFVSQFVGSEYGGLSHLFSTDLPQAVDTSIERPTDSLRGRLGGLVPAKGSVVAPGPTSTPDSAVLTEAPAGQTAVATTGSGLHKLRKAFGL
jgi:hypothetical protein